MSNEEITKQTDMTCRIENLGKYAVPICGHDVLTEFMVQDLKTKPTNGIFFFGGLYANESEDRFFWYVSTMRAFSSEKIPSMVSGGKRVEEYLSEIIQGDRMEILYSAFKGSLDSEDDNVEKLIHLGLLSYMKDGRIGISEKGIELCCILAHLTVNHRYKPPPQQLNVIFESFMNAGLYSPDSQWRPDQSMTIEKAITQLTDTGELKKLTDNGIEEQQLFDMVQLYLCPPF